MKKLACIFIFIGLTCGVSCDKIWLKLWSETIAEAVGNSTTKPLIQVAEDLALYELVSMINKAGLYPLLSGVGPFTFFAPVDKAFQDLPLPFFTYLMNNVTALAEVLKYHVTDGVLTCKDFKNDQLLPSRQGNDIRINIYEDGKTITASGRPVTTGDQVASNGVLNVMGAILLPPGGTIDEIVNATADLSTLKKALRVVPDMEKALTGKGPYTLFAPSDAAFRLIPENCLNALLVHPEQLTDVLSFHILPVTAYKANFTVQQDVKTVLGELIHITNVFGDVRVNHARVTLADVSATNGVIHVIDQLLFPRAFIDYCNPYKRVTYQKYDTALRFIRQN